MYDHKNGTAFRKLERSDLDLLLCLKQDSWVTTHHTAFVTKEDQIRWFDSIPSNACHFVCFRRESYTDLVFDKDRTALESKDRSIPVGLLSLTNIDWISRVASIGGSIFHDHRGTEWAKKAWEAGTDFAFEMFNLHRIEGEVLENNPASLHMDISLGYKVEGMRRKCVYKSGQYLNSYLFGLLRSEWEESVGRRYGDICNVNYRFRRSASKVLERAKVLVPSYLPQDVLSGEEASIDSVACRIETNPDS